MKNRNKVIQALKCCIKYEDQPCDGNCLHFGKNGCVAYLMADLLKLLESMEAEGE